MATAITNFFRRRRTSSGGGGGNNNNGAPPEPQPPAADNAVTPRALSLQQHTEEAPRVQSPPPPPGLRAAITRFRGEDDQSYEARLEQIEGFIHQELTAANDHHHHHPQPPLSPAGPTRVPGFPSAASSAVSAGYSTSSSSLGSAVPASLMRAVTRLKNESEEAYQDRIRTMTVELDSYCRSESFRLDFRRPDGKGWINPAEAAEGQGGL